MVRANSRMKTIRTSFTRRLVLTWTAVAMALAYGPSFVLGESKVDHASAPEGRKIMVSVDPRVELIGIVFRLAGNPEFNSGTLRPYVKAIERQFGDFDQHEAVRLAARLRNTRSMSCDGPMSLAVHIDSDYRLRETPEKWPGTLDERWTEEETAEFLTELRQFASDTKFDEFFQAHRGFYDEGKQSCKRCMSQLDLENWLLGFFGVEDPGDLRLVLGFVNGFCSYGCQVMTGPIREEYAIVGMRPFDADNTVIFLPQSLGTAAHEFCHSFANPVLDKYMNQLRPAGERLFAAQPAVRAGGYQRWESVMYETVVRGCVGSWVRQRAAEYMGSFLQDEVNAGFVWTEDVTNLFKNYENNRDQYPTFESFFPEFVTFLNDYTARKG
jgi:hypothetical protein